MKKKFGIFTLVLLILLSSLTSVSLASSYQVLNPSKKAFSTRNRIVLVNGKAPTGTRVIIDLYGTTDVTRSNFNLANLPKNQDYIKRFTESVRAGNMGYWQKEIALALGVNKVDIKFEKTAISEQIIIYVYDKATLEQNRALVNLK